MKNFVFVVLASVLAAVLGGFAAASDTKGNYGIFGDGLDSCAKVMEEYKKDSTRYQFYITWVSGYMTAMGFEKNTQQTFTDAADIDAVMYIVRQYCESNPLERLYTASYIAMNKLLDKAGRR